MKYAVFFLLIITTTSVSLSQTITTTEWTQFVSSDAIPKDIKCRNSNNNIDLVQFKGRYYCAFRTAPTHFASKKTV
ncbi:MAG TPA: hypothetical protein PKI86_11545, partial [Chitinophagales bacterium]|nr:hypothetical protein [Chitinophagales bacterium]